jgi:hypothetical protein
MGVRRAQDRGVQRPRRHRQIVGIAAASGQQGEILAPLERLADARARHLAGMPPMSRGHFRATRRRPATGKQEPFGRNPVGRERKFVRGNAGATRCVATKRLVCAPGSLLASLWAAGGWMTPPDRLSWRLREPLELPLVPSSGSFGTAFFG